MIFHALFALVFMRITFSFCLPQMNKTLIFKKEEFLILFLSKVFDILGYVREFSVLVEHWNTYILNNCVEKRGNSFFFFSVV